jgi:cell division protease FtsH
VIVGKPDVKGRLKILEVHTKKTPLSGEVNLEKVARGTPGFSGADLENIVNEAALVAARRNKRMLDMDDFELAKDKVLMGAERKSMVVNEEDKKITAYHEAGHTIVGKTIPGNDPIHKVSIIPRGMALGVTQTLPAEERMNLTKQKAHNMIAFLFGGRAAEELIFKDYTTGAGNDIERATDIARRMVCEWGMSEKLGPLAYERREGPVFLGMQSNESRGFSESTAQEIDAEVRKFVNEGHERALKILSENMDALHRLSQALLERETIDGDEVELIMKGGSVTDIDRERNVRANDLAIESEAKRKEQDKADAEAKADAEKKSKKDPLGDPDPAMA